VSGAGPADGAGGANPGPDPLASGPPGLGREARHPLVGGRRVGDLVASVLLLALQLVVAFVAGWGAVFLAFAFDSCGAGAGGRTCNTELGSVAILGAPILVGVLFVAAVIVTVLRLVRRRLSWPVPMIGTVLSVGVFFLALLAVRLAVPGF
jgi:hypothetical protein